MKKYKIVLGSPAKADIRSHYKYIEQRLRNKTAADRLYHDINKAINNLSQMPGRYVVVDFGERDNKGVRAMIVRNYKIYYYFEEKPPAVQILRVLHGRQNHEDILFNDGNIYPKYIHEYPVEYDADYSNSTLNYETIKRSSADLRNNYSIISELINEYNNHVIITKNGEADVALVSVEEYERLSSLL